MTIDTPPPIDDRPTDQPDRAPDHADVAIHPPILWVLLVLGGIGVNYLFPIELLPPSMPNEWLGAAIWLVGFGIALVAIWQFRQARTDVQVHTPTSAIVQSGLYRWSRNPIYLGGHIGLVGVAVGFDSLWVLLGLVPFYLIIRYGVIAPEEAYLERKFGAIYLNYKKNVRRWL